METINNTNKEVLGKMGLTEQALISEARTIVENMKETILNTSSAFRAANEGILNMYVALDSQSKAFFTKNHIEVERGWTKYFMPVLVTLFPYGAWSYSTLKRFRSINDSPVKKTAYLNLRDAVSEKAQAAVKRIVTPESLLKSALTRINNILEKNKNKFHISIVEGLLVLISPKQAPVVIPPVKAKPVKAKTVKAVPVAIPAVN